MIRLAQPARTLTLASSEAGRAPLRQALGEDPAVLVAFSDRAHGNVSLTVGGGDPAAARRRLAAAVGLDAGDLVIMEQVHGGAVARVDAADRGRGVAEHADAIAGVDALVTTAPGVGLAVMIADCVPILLAVPGAGVAAVHAGRQGVLARVAPAAVEALAACAGASAAQVVAVIGPAIGGCCYELPADMAAELAEQTPEAGAETTWGTPSADLPAAVTAQLAAAGVARVERILGCTRCDSERWFSHRAGPPEGRQAGVIWRAPAAPTSDPLSLD